MLAGEDRLQCGCIRVRFTDGKIYQSGCLMHRMNRQYVCPSCGKDFRAPKPLLEHRWVHAY